jgi:hypothetical protein
MDEVHLQWGECNTLHVFGFATEFSLAAGSCVVVQMRGASLFITERKTNAGLLARARQRRTRLRDGPMRLHDDGEATLWTKPKAF